MAEGQNADTSINSRRTFLTSAGAAGAALLAGCTGDGGDGGGSGDGDSGGDGSGTSTGNNQSSKGTLELNLFSGQLSSSNKEAFDQYLTEWEEQSDWSINTTMTGQGSGVTQKELARFEAGDPFDVMTVMGVAAFNFAANGYLASLDDFMADSTLNKEDFATSTLIEGCLEGRGPFNGNIQVLPMMMGHWGALYYNADLFEQAGYDPMNPQEYLKRPSQMLEVARDIKSQTGVRPLGFSGADHVQTALQFYGHIWSRGDQRAMVEDGQSLFSTEEGLGAAELYHTMGEEDLMPTGVLSKNAIDMRNLFQVDETAMYTVGTWDSALLKEESDVRFGITYVPYAEGAAPSGFGGSPTWGIAKDISTERQEASWSLLEYLMTPERQAKWSGLVPTLQAAWDPYFDGFTDGLGREVSQVFEEQINNSGWPYLAAEVGTVNQIAQSTAQNLIAGEKSPEQAMNDADQQVKDQIL